MKQKVETLETDVQWKEKKKKKKKEDHIEIFRKQRGGGVPVIEKQLHIIHYTAILIFFTAFRNRRKVLNDIFLWNHKPVELTYITWGKLLAYT